MAAQHAGQKNHALMAWSGQNSAPIAAFNDKRLLTTAESIILLAERLGPDPKLVTISAGERAWMFGLLRELLGEDSLAWYRRIAGTGMSGNADPKAG